MTGPQRILRPSTAFSVASTKQRKPRERDEKHLAWIRTLRCCICGKPGPDAAHIRAASALHGKRETGGQEKPSDKWCVPLCREHHDAQHKTNELLWWASQGIDPFGLALSLFAATGDDDLADAILKANAPKVAR